MYHRKIKFDEMTPENEKQEKNGSKKEKRPIMVRLAIFWKRSQITGSRKKDLLCILRSWTTRTNLKNCTCDGQEYPDNRRGQMRCRNFISVLYTKNGGQVTYNLSYTCQLSDLLFVSGKTRNSDLSGRNHPWQGIYSGLWLLVRKPHSWITAAEIFPRKLINRNLQ